MGEGAIGSRNRETGVAQRCLDVRVLKNVYGGCWDEGFIGALERRGRMQH